MADMLGDFFKRKKKKYRVVIQQKGTDQGYHSEGPVASETPGSQMLTKQPSHLPLDVTRIPSPARGRQQRCVYSKQTMVHWRHAAEASTVMWSAVPADPARAAKGRKPHWKGSLGGSTSV